MASKKYLKKCKNTTIDIILIMILAGIAYIFTPEIRPILNAMMPMMFVVLLISIAISSGSFWNWIEKRKV